jgi:hypothetical protein
LAEVGIKAVSHDFLEHQGEHPFHLRRSLKKQFETCLKQVSGKVWGLKFFSIFDHFFEHVRCVLNILTEVTQQPTQSGFAVDIVDI